MLTSALLVLLLQLPAPVSGQPPAAPAAGPVVILDTTAGSIVIQLFPDKAPDSVNNFLEYVRDGFYSGTIFHRVVPGYVVQGGGYTPELVEKTTRPPVRNEATNGLTNVRGTVAMARTRAVRSATSQFFINLANNARLDHHGLAPDDYGYAVFGRVIEGMDVVDRIAAMATTSRDGMDDVPVTPVVIKSVVVRSASERRE
ncbi:MAG TPA: peptidylprolyl isomerase [Vicinamibacterales bacterium]|nr:peptidylprolyl isomerase [Vicinamibacterales bacterium]